LTIFDVRVSTIEKAISAKISKFVVIIYSL